MENVEALSMVASLAAGFAARETLARYLPNLRPFVGWVALVVVTAGLLGIINFSAVYWRNTNPTTEQLAGSVEAYPLIGMVVTSDPSLRAGLRDAISRRDQERL